MTGPRVLEAHPVTPAACAHGEGPVWDEREGVLRFVDLTRGDVMTFDPHGSAAGPETADVLRRLHVADVVAALRPRTSGGWVLALERGFALTEPGSWRAGALIEAFTHPASRMNDGGCDAGGGFLCGSMAYVATPSAGSLYRLAPDGSVSEVLAGVTISNGFCVDATGALAYYIDTPTRRIDVFDLESDGATLTGRRPFVHIEPGAGLPDGLTVDAEGGVWVALYGGSAVRRYLPDGSLDTVVTVPTPHVTAPAFGGEDLRDLYITTSQEGIDVAADRLAGSLFHTEPGPRGLAPRPYAG